MKAYVYTQYGGSEHQKFIELDMPIPGPAELLVAVRAAGVNPTDWKRRSGDRSGDATLDRPRGLGREIAGVVTSVGKGVTNFTADDNVLGTVNDDLLGGIAQYTLLAADRSVRKPPEISFLDAAALPLAATTAYDGVRQVDLALGQTLLIVGAGGGVGIAACQIANSRGIQVVGTSSQSKKDIVESVGATFVRSGEGVAERIRSVAPHGVDAVLDLVGGDALREVVDLVADRSKVVSVADRATASELGGAGIDRNRDVSILQAVVRLAEEGKLDPRVTQVFPFEEAGEALALVESGHATGKIVIQVS